VRRKQRIDSQFLQEFGIAFQSGVDKDTRLMGVGDDLFHEPIPVIAVGGCHSIPERIGLDAFNFVVQITPFFVKEALTIRDQELHVPRLRMIDGGKVDFVENPVRNGEPYPA
jgi:hypothetical protein